MYKIIKAKPSVREIYAQKLIKEKVISEEEKKFIESEVVACHNISYEKLKEFKYCFHSG